MIVILIHIHQGSVGFEKHVDTLFENVAHFTEFIRKRQGFQLILDQPPFVNVCFWYVPPSLQNRKDDKDYDEKLHKVKLKKLSNYCVESQLPCPK